MENKVHTVSHTDSEVFSTEVKDFLNTFDSPYQIYYSTSSSTVMNATMVTRYTALIIY